MAACRERRSLADPGEMLRARAIKRSISETASGSAACRAWCKCWAATSDSQLLAVHLDSTAPGTVRQGCVWLIACIVWTCHAARGDWPVARALNYVKNSAVVHVPCMEQQPCPTLQACVAILLCILCLFFQPQNLTSTCQRSQLGSDLSQLPTIGLAILPHDFSLE